MAMQDFTRGGRTTVNNLTLIPNSVTASYRRLLEGYHPQIGIQLSTVIDQEKQCLMIELEGEVPQQTKDLFSALEFVEIPSRSDMLMSRRITTPESLHPWELNSATIEKVPLSDTQQIILQWQFPGHEFVYSAWKWG